MPSARTSPPSTPKTALRDHWRPGQDPWQALFDTVANRRPQGTSDLVPWWIHPGPHHVERRVPLLPSSCDQERLTRLKKDLVAYRLVFGQPRQQELLSLVRQSGIDTGELQKWVLDLRPPEVATVEPTWAQVAGARRR